jgi:hypothetical protein
MALGAYLQQRKFSLLMAGAQRPKLSVTKFTNILGQFKVHKIYIGEKDLDPEQDLDPQH